MKNKQIQEFFTKVAQDESFKAEVLKLQKGIEAKKLNEQDVQKFVKEKLLPKAKKLGYDFSEKDLADFGNSQEMANLTELSPEDLENVSGGVNKGFLGAIFSLAMFMGVGAGAANFLPDFGTEHIAYAGPGESDTDTESDIEVEEEQPARKRRKVENGNAVAQPPVRPPQPQGQPVRLLGQRKREVRCFSTQFRAATEAGTIPGVHDVSWTNSTSRATQGRIFKGEDIGRFSDNVYNAGFVYLLRPAFDCYAIQIPKGKQLMLLMYDTYSQQLNALRLGDKNKDTYFVIKGNDLWVSQNTPTKGIYDLGALNRGDDGFCCVSQCVVRRAGGTKGGKNISRISVGSGDIEMDVADFKNVWSKQPETRKIVDVVFNAGTAAVSVQDSGEVYLLPEARADHGGAFEMSYEDAQQLALKSGRPALPLVPPAQPPVQQAPPVGPPARQARRRRTGRTASQVGQPARVTGQPARQPGQQRIETAMPIVNVPPQQPDYLEPDIDLAPGQENTGYAAPALNDGDTIILPGGETFINSWNAVTFLENLLRCIASYGMNMAVVYNDEVKEILLGYFREYFLFDDINISNFFQDHVFNVPDEQPVFPVHFGDTAKHALQPGTVITWPDGISCEVDADATSTANNLLRAIASNKQELEQHIKLQQLLKRLFKEVGIYNEVQMYDYWLSVGPNIDMDMELDTGYGMDVDGFDN